jgi:hypothetical protein
MRDNIVPLKRAVFLFIPIGLPHPKNEAGILIRIWFSDEACFHVNKQNVYYRPLQNAEIVTDSPLHPRQVTLWCAVSGILIFEPVFIEGTFSSQVYLDIVVTQSAKVNLTFQMCSS